MTAYRTPITTRPAMMVLIDLRAVKKGDEIAQERPAVRASDFGRVNDTSARWFPFLRPNEAVFTATVAMPDGTSSVLYVYPRSPVRVWIKR